MATAAPSAAHPRVVDGFFELSLLGMLASGYLAVLASGALDAPAAILAGIALVLRLAIVTGWFRWTLPARAVQVATFAYIAFYGIDYFFLSRDFLQSTIHLIFFLSGMKLLTAHTVRDYSYLKLIAFLELLTASMTSVSLTFSVCLAAFLLCSIAAFASGEIKHATRGSSKESKPNPPMVVRGGMRGFRWRLGTLSVSLFAGILVLTAGLFFLLPRTARAAFRHLVSDRYRLPGFSNEVVLGQLGEIKRSSQTVMHVKLGTPEKQPPYRWRGMTLSQFDGRKWFNPPATPELVRVDGWLQLAPDKQRWRSGSRISYEVHLKDIASDVLFMPGTPEMLHVNAPYIYRTRYDALRARMPAEGGLYYTGISFLDAESPLPADPPELSDRMRAEYLRLPELDGRIAVLARRFTDGHSMPGLRARSIESHLQKDYGYTLELLSKEVTDPLAYFLFERKRGHCEYFASAMAVMLRTLGIPSRVATGFAGGTYNSVSGWHVIRASDAHSWVEAWLPGRGWTVFDPTPPDPNPMAHSFATTIGEYLDAADVFWQDWVLSYDLERQISLASRMEESGRKVSVSWVDQFGNWLERSGKPTASSTWRWGLALVLLAAAGGFAAMHWRRGWNWLVARWRLRRVQRGQADASDAALLYRRMLDLVKKRGVEKPAWFTAGEFTSVLGSSETAKLVAEFTSDYERLRFGGQREAAVRMVGVLEKLEKLA
ncbi:MAG: DUF3488 and transglutaminase-like domain-containing protein [Bryobacteraceae bacterium]